MHVDDTEDLEPGDTIEIETNREITLLATVENVSHVRENHKHIRASVQEDYLPELDWLDDEPQKALEVSIGIDIKPEPDIMSYDCVVHGGAGLDWGHVQKLD